MTLIVQVKPISWLKSEVVKEKYNAKYVGEFALPVKNGYSEQAWPVFYTATPDKSKGHSHYFALILQGQNVMISNASFIEGKLISAIRAFNGEVIYSAAVHDFVESSDGSCWIDGGFDYTRYGYPTAFMAPKPFLITVKDGEFCYITEAANDSDAPEEIFQYKPA